MIAEWITIHHLSSRIIFSKIFGGINQIFKDTSN